MSVVSRGAMSSVRWLQTSDVHLRADRPERRHALLSFDP